MSELSEFQFNITEVNQITTIDAVTIPTIDSQQHQELTCEELQQLFDRVRSQLVTESTDEQEFFKRESALKPPKTTQIIQTPFPPPAEERLEIADLNIEQLKQLAKQDAGPLIIERYSPNETKIDNLLTNITITFNQPMIAVSSLSDENMNIENFGITLTPTVEGQWRWIGAKTIQFEVKYRFLFSTTYTVEINKEHCQSSIGGKSIPMFYDHL